MVKAGDIHGFVRELRRLYGLEGELDVRDLGEISEKIDISAAVVRRGPPLKGGNIFMLYLGDKKAYDTHGGRTLEVGDDDRVILFGRFVQEALGNFKGSSCDGEKYAEIAKFYHVEMTVKEFGESVPGYGMESPEDIGRIIQPNSVDCGLYTLALAAHLDPLWPKS